MVYAHPNICTGEWHTQTPPGFWHTNGSLNPGQTSKLYDNQQHKKKNLQNCGLCCIGWSYSKIKSKLKEG